MTVSDAYHLIRRMQREGFDRETIGRTVYSLMFPDDDVVSGSDKGKGNGGNRSPEINQSYQMDVQGWS